MARFCTVYIAHIAYCPIRVLLMCHTGNVNPLVLRTSRLQNGCNGTVISLGSLTGQRQADLLPSPWYRHNTYHHHHHSHYKNHFCTIK